MKVEGYEHLNEPYEIGMDIDSIAKQIVDANYGIHRMLFALIKYSKKKQGEQWGKYHIMYHIEKVVSDWR